MKKTVLLFTALIVFSSICFAVPSQPTDKSSFSNTIPTGSIPPDPTFITSNITNPIPTNKFFNSVINNPYHNY